MYNFSFFFHCLFLLLFFKLISLFNKFYECVLHLDGWEDLWVVSDWKKAGNMAGQWNYISGK